VLSHRARIVEQAAAVLQELRTLAREQQAAPDAIEELQPQLVLEAGDLAGKRRLRGVKLIGDPGYGAEVGHGDEGAYFTQIHGFPPHASNA
jgi:hypothetical protein